MKKLLSFFLALLILAGSVYGTESAEDYIFPDDWSRDALIFAVENGILNGDKDHALHPERNITRAEMAAVMVRLLGASEQADLSKYWDVTPSAWYYDELSAAVAANIFKGTTASTLSPGAYITREQAAVVLCRSFGIVSEKQTCDFKDAGSISSYAKDDVCALFHNGLANGYTDGTFRPKAYITRAEIAQLLYKLFDCIADTPEEIPAAGSVLYRGTEPLPEELTLDGSLVLGLAMPGKILAGKWRISEGLVLRTVSGTHADLFGLTSSRLVCAAQNCTLSATVPELWLRSSNVSLNGESNALTVIEGTHRATGDYGTICLRKGSLSLTGTADTVHLYQKTALSLDGTVQNLYFNGENAIASGNGHAVNVTVYVKSYTLTLTYNNLRDTIAEAYQKEHDAALETVQTTHIPCTVLYNCTLYADRNLSKPIATLSKGETVYNQWYPSGDRFEVSRKDGTLGWVLRSYCSIHADTVTTNGALDYSKPTKEGFVDLMGYSSATNYLIWVSRYTQKVMVFQGSKGNWKLIKTMPCSSGSNYTPTPGGIYKLRYHTPKWYFTSYYVTNVSSFTSGGHAFHSILYNYNGSIYDGRVGIPLSHGCVRMLEQDCAYIYRLPVETTIIIF